LTAEGTAFVNIGNGVFVEVTAQRQGETSIFISPQDIILCKTAIESSARNEFRGRIIEITDWDSIVKLKVDVGKVFAVQITKKSFKELALNLGSDVYIAFKASSVNVL
jgi:molybdopterin-binding protein